MLRKNILSFLIALLFFNCTDVVCQTSTNDDHSVYKDAVLPLLSDIKIYGAFSSNYRIFSQQYADYFRNLFHEEAQIWNFFTSETASVNSFIDYVRRRYPAGYFFDVIIEDYEVRTGIQNRSRYFIVDAKIQIDGTDKDQKRFTFEKDVVFVVSKTNSELDYRIQSIKERELHFIEKIIVQLVDVNDLNQLHKGIAVDLFLHDVVIQKTRTDEKGRATFVGVPQRAAYFVRIAENQGITYSKLRIVPSAGFTTDHIFTLPIRPHSSLFPAVFFGAGVGFINRSFQTTNQVDTLPGVHLKERGIANFYSAGISNTLFKSKGFSLIGSAGLEIIYADRRFRDMSLNNSFWTVDIDNDSVLFMIDIIDGKIVSKESFLAVPLALSFFKAIDVKEIKAFDIELTFKPQINLQTNKSRQLTISSKGYYPQYGFVLEDLPMYNYYSEIEVTSSSSEVKEKFSYAYGVSTGLFIDIPKTRIKSKLTLRMTWFNKPVIEDKNSTITHLPMIDPVEQWMTSSRARMYSVDFKLYIPYK